MSSRNLIIIGALVLAVGAYIFFIEQHQPTTTERLEKADRIFAQLDESAVIALELRTSRGVINLEKIDDDWQLVEPLVYPADAGAVRSLIQSIVALESERALSFDEIELSDYGLDAPILGLALVDDAGARFELAVGTETPLGPKRAVRRGEDDEVLLCSGTFVSSLDKELDQWRSRDVVETFESELASIEVATSADLIRVTRAGNHWQLEEPVADLADAEQMRSLVSELNALRISEFLTEEDPRTDPGPDGWEYRIVLTPADGGEAVTLELAAPTKDATAITSRRNGAELIRIPEGIRTRLAKAPVLWRAPKVWPFSSLDAGKLEISSEVDSVLLDEVDGLWVFSDGGEADGAEVRRRLNALVDLEVREHDLVQPPTEVMGSVILVLDDDEGAEGLTYTFYAPIEIGGHAAVTVSARNNVMGVDAAIAEMILGDLDRLHPARVDANSDDQGATDIE